MVKVNRLVMTSKVFGSRTIIRDLPAMNADSQMLIGSFQSHAVKEIGKQLSVCHFNIEGMSRAKGEILHRIMSTNRVDIILLQETHIADEQQMHTRGRVPGYCLVTSICHPKYGVATYARAGIENIQVVSNSSVGNIFTSVVKINDLQLRISTSHLESPGRPWYSHSSLTQQLIAAT
jgi:hypothetical protein